MHPGRNREALLHKRNRLLQKLFELGWIDHSMLITSLAEKIPDKPNPMPVLAPHMLNRIWKAHPGATIQTTIDRNLQSAVFHIIDKHHNQHKLNEIHNAAAVVLEVETGNILAYIGNCGYPSERLHGNDVDIIQSLRSTGSLLKPLLYSAMMDDGKLLPGSLIADIPINLGGFSPQNFNGDFGGAVPASNALSRSLNVPAVQLLKQYGVDRFHHLIRSLGMNTVDKPASWYGLSLILGGAEGTLEEMTNVYASLSRVLKHYGQSGNYLTNDYREVCFIQKADTIAQHPMPQAEIFNASSIWYTYQSMIEVNRPDEETGWQYFGSSRKIAWKTGTSFGYRDGWAIGTSSEYVVGVWIGNADGEGRPGLTGVALAAPVMFEIFSVLPVSDWFAPPVDEMIPAVVCHKSGYLAGPYCDEKDSMNIPLAGLKSSVCPFHKWIHLSTDGQNRVTGNCYPVDRMIHKSWFVLPPVQEWYYKRHNAGYQILPPYLKSCDPGDQRSMDLVYPREEVKIYIPRGLKGDKGRVVFEAVHSDPDATIFWHLDDQYLAATKFIHQMELLPAEGHHVIILIDENGEELIRKFEMVEP
jgi:penicillin-binding protein 1C